MFKNVAKNKRVRQEQLRRLINSWLVIKRITVAVPNMDLLNDNECTTRLKHCCKKLVNKSIEDIHPYSRDGIMTAKTESLCQILDGQRST